MTELKHRLRFMPPAILLAATLILPPAAAADDSGTGGRFITVALSGHAASGKSAAPQPGKSTQITVSLRDPSSGFAMRGVGVAAWIVPDDGRSCGDWYARIGRVGELPDDVIPLLGFDILQATQDNRLALVDPLLNLASANIRSVTTFPAPFTAWSPAADGQTLGVIDGAAGTFSIVEPASGAVRTVTLPARARSVESDADGYRVGLDNGMAVHVSPEGLGSAPQRIGTAPVTILPAVGSEALVALSLDGHARLFNAAGTTVTLPGAVRGGVVSPIANSLIALADSGRELFIADLDDTATPTRVPLDFAADRIAGSPAGRWLALADKDGGTIAIFDTQTMRVRWTVNVPDPVVEMTFSDNFLYFMHRKQGGVTRVIFDPDGSAPGLAAIAAGLPSEEPQRAGPLPRLVRIPAGGVLVASSRERQAYIVSESGAQAAMAMVPLRAGTTAGIAIRQRGMLPSSEPGTYTGRFTAPAAGAYRAVIRTDAPEMLMCQNFVVGDSARVTRTVAAKPAPATSVMTASVETDRIRLHITGTPAVPVRALLMQPTGNWREFLAPAVSGPETILQMPEPPPPPGQYRLFVEVARPDGTVETLSNDIAIGGNGS